MDKTGGFFLIIILAMLLIWVAVNPNLTDMLANKTADEDDGSTDGGSGSNDGMTPRERHNQSIADYNERHGVNLSSGSGKNPAQVTKLNPAATTLEEVTEKTMTSISRNNVFAPMGVIGGRVLVKK